MFVPFFSILKSLLSAHLDFRGLLLLQKVHTTDILNGKSLKALIKGNKEEQSENPFQRACHDFPEERFIDDRQITHLICVRLRHLLYDLFWGGVWAFYLKKQEGGPKHPPKSHIANVLGGHRLDE